MNTTIVQMNHSGETKALELTGRAGLGVDTKGRDIVLYNVAGEPDRFARNTTDDGRLSRHGYLGGHGYCHVVGELFA